MVKRFYRAVLEHALSIRLPGESMASALRQLNACWSGPPRLPAMGNQYATLRLPVDVLYGREDRILDWRHHGGALKRKLDHTTLR